MVPEFRDIGGDLCCRGIFLEAMDKEPVDGGGDSIGETEGLLEFGLKIRSGAKAGGCYVGSIIRSLAAHTQV